MKLLLLPLLSDPMLATNGYAVDMVTVFTLVMLLLMPLLSMILPFCSVSRLVPGATVNGEEGGVKLP